MNEYTFAVTMEIHFNITVEDDAVNTLKTVEDIVKYIEAHQ